MLFINHYSVLIAWFLFIAGGISVVSRHGRKPRHWAVLATSVAALSLVWWMMRPQEGASNSGGSSPTLLELQSPYCFACVAEKPVVDRASQELQGRLVIRRVNIQTVEGRKLMQQFGAEATPTFIFLDRAGSEQWRSIGKLDVDRLKSSVD